MSSISSVNAGIGSLLGGLGGASSSLFSAISGGGSSTSSDGLLNAISGGSGQNINQLLNQQQYNQKRNGILTEVANRMGYIRSGQLEPSSDWEKVAAYAMETGQPMVASLNDKGQVEATPQADSDLSRFNPMQQKLLYEAMDQVSEMSAKIRGNKENDKLINKLENANDLIQAFSSGLMAPKASWETEANLLMTMKTPFTIALDNKGEIMIQDQTTADFGSMPIEQQKILRKAATDVRTALQTGNYNALWQADAKTFADSNVSFHLEVDSITHAISAVENKGSNIVPAFLREAPYPNIGDDTPWKKEAAQMIKDGKPFFLDFDQTGKLAIKEATAPNLIKYSSPQKSYGQFNPGSVMSIIA